MNTELRANELSLEKTPKSFFEILLVDDLTSPAVYPLSPQAPCHSFLVPKTRKMLGVPTRRVSTLGGMYQIVHMLVKRLYLMASDHQRERK